MSTVGRGYLLQANHGHSAALYTQTIGAIFDTAPVTRLFRGNVGPSLAGLSLTSTKEDERILTGDVVEIPRSR